MLSCRELTELVTDYIEGRMPLRRRLAFRFHLLVCSRCRAYVRQLRMTIELLGRLPVEPPPPDVAEALRRRFRRWRRDRD